jgi:DNA polymerase III subunit delta'
MADERPIELPWLAPQMEQLRRARLGGRFPPALLIHEQRGAGGLWLARYAAQLAFCRDPHPPCGHCRGCRQFLAGQHPDYLVLAPIEESKWIRIEQVRELNEQLSLTAHGGGATVVLLTPADALYPNAADALLKTLEEPRPGVTLILLTSLPSRLPATILSRCQRLRIAAPSRAESVQWLEQHKGAGPWDTVLDVIGDAPTEAVELDAAEIERLAKETFGALTALATGRQDVPGLAERWARQDNFDLRLACIETWLTACIDRAAGTPAQSPELRTAAHLPESSWDMNIAALLRLLHGAYELRSLRLTSINRGVALEQLLWQLPRTVRTAAAS